MSRHLQTLFLLAVLSFLFVIPTQAQVTTASMSGTVMFQDEPVIGATGITRENTLRLMPHVHLGYIVSTFVSRKISHSRQVKPNIISN